MTKPIIILAGPTASGKSSCALDIAKQMDSVIINADSKQVFKEIPIITAQPTEDEKRQVPHELYGIISSAEHCSVARWLALACESIRKAHAENKTPILVGGTGMYIKSLTDGLSQTPDTDEKIRQEARELLHEIGNEKFHAELARLDPEMATKLNVGDSQRILRAYEVVKQTGESLSVWQNRKTIPVFPKESFSQFLLLPTREQLYENCDKRFSKMVEDGAIEEVKNLMDMNLDKDLPAMRAYGVPEIIQYLKGEYTLDQAMDKAQQYTRNYVKRQLTWFKHQMKDAKIISGYSDELKKHIP